MLEFNHLLTWLNGLIPIILSVEFGHFVSLRRKNCLNRFVLYDRYNIFFFCWLHESSNWTSNIVIVDIEDTNQVSRKKIQHTKLDYCFRWFFQSVFSFRFVFSFLNLLFIVFSFEATKKRINFWQQISFDLCKFFHSFILYKISQNIQTLKAEV